MLDDAQLTRRSVLGLGEMLAALGCGGAGSQELRRPDALGARIAAAAGNPWIDAAVVPPGAAPPADDPSLPTALWTLAGAVPGRVEAPEIALPCMGVALDDPVLKLGDVAGHETEAAPFAVVGDLNERAYGSAGWFVPVLQALRTERIRTHGLRAGDGRFVCVAMTLALGDDLAIHYVATEASHRRRGLASRLVRTVMAAARAQGLRSATLQASDDGLPTWTRLGFRRVATLRAFLRPGDRP